MEKYIVLNGFYDCYAVSNIGNVKNLRNGHILKNTLGKDGYLSVLLCRNGKQTRIRIHRLVATYFIDNTEEKPDVNHIDGDKTNNHLTNLEWCTKSENMVHALENNLKTTEYSNRNILVYDSENGEFLYSFESVKQCAKILGLNPSPIYRVLKGKNKKHHNYNFKYENRI